MQNKDVHKAIRRIFKLSRKGTSIPRLPPKKLGRNLLPVLFKELQYNVGAEIGVRVGNFSTRLCDANPELHLYCVDSWTAYNATTSQRKQDVLHRRAVEKLAPLNVTIIHKTSIEALNDIADESLDFVYIDADHTYNFVCPDIISWSQKVRSGGIIACHDYNIVTSIDVVKAVDGYVCCNNIRPWYTTRETQSTAFWVKP